MNSDELNAFEEHVRTLPKSDIRTLQDSISSKQTDMFQLERILCKIYRGG